VHDIPLAQYILEVTLSIRQPDDGIWNAETCCHVTDSVINKYLLCSTEKLLNLY
jgi:hypothetical protein